MSIAEIKIIQTLIVRQVRYGLFALALLCSLPTGVLAQALDEYAVKAAFMLNFARFIQWPEEAFHDSQKTLDLCVAGGRIIEQSFRQTIDGEEVGDKTLHVYLVSDDGPFDGCEMIFIRRDTNRSALLRIGAMVKEKPILTIGEMNGFASIGGIINFFNKEEKLYFEINPDRASQQKLKISSRLLNLAVIVGAK